MKEIVGFVCILIGVLLIGIGVYVHWTTVIDIPAAAMTQRLEWSGWGWDAGGLASWFVSWLCLQD
jgi:hypothetical protein